MWSVVWLSTLKYPKLKTDYIKWFWHTVKVASVSFAILKIRSNVDDVITETGKWKLAVIFNNFSRTFYQQECFERYHVLNKRKKLYRQKSFAEQIWW